MRERLASTASSTAKTIRTILADAAAMHHERPSRPELTCGVCTRGASVPIGVAALVCLIFDWKFAITIGRDWSNTFLVIALIFSFTLNLFLFVNMLMQLVEHPLAIKTRRHLSCVDMAIVILLIVGIAERIRGTRWGSRPIYYEPTRSGVQMLLVVFSLILSFLHIVAGATMAVVAMRNWVQVQRLSPEEYNEYKLGLRPLYPPPAYGT